MGYIVIYRFILSHEHTTNLAVIKIFKNISMALTSKGTSQILFICPENPSKSFLQPFQREKANSEKLEHLLDNISNEKQLYVEVNDVFGRNISIGFSIEDLRSFQPLYITSSVPKTIQITIKVGENDRIVNVDIDPKNTVVDLSKRIEEETGLPYKQQEFLLKTSLLSNNRRLIDQQINKSGTELNLILKQKVRIHCEKGEFFIYVNPNRTQAFFLAPLISEETGIPHEQLRSLWKGDKEIRLGINILTPGPSTSFQDLHIKEPDTLELKLNIEIVVNVLGQTLKVQTSQNANVSELKKTFERYLSFASFGAKFKSETYHFELGGVIIKEDSLLKECMSNTNLLMDVKPNHGNLWIHLNNANRPFYAILEENKTVLDIKNDIIGNYGKDESLKLYLNNQELNNSEILVNLNSKDSRLEITHEALYQSKKICIKTLIGRTVFLEVNSNDTVETLKSKFQEKEDVSSTLQAIFFSCCELDNKQSLGSYLIFEGSILHLRTKLAPGIPNSAKKIDIDFSNSTPKWQLITGPGLCIEGKCLNNECVAYKQTVFINKGIGTFDAFYEYGNNKCPMCSGDVIIKACGFNNCKFAYTGVILKKGGRQIKRVFSQREGAVGANYRKYPTKRIGTVDWLALKIITISLNYNKLSEDDLCGICRTRLKLNHKSLSCGHTFHKDCLDKIKVLNTGCVYCYI